MLRERIHALFNKPTASDFDAICTAQNREHAIKYVLGFFNESARPKFEAEFAALAAKDDQIANLREQIKAAETAKARGWTARVKELRARIKAVEAS